MKRRLLALLLALALVFSLSPSSFANVIEAAPKQEIRVIGTIRRVQVEDPNYPNGVLMLYPDQPVQVHYESLAAGKWVTETITRFQVTVDSSYEGRRVALTGQVMAAHTAHHHSPIVLYNCSLEAPPYPFTDVDQTAYYVEPLQWAVYRNITNGTSPTTFSPNLPCTRAQLVTFQWRMHGCPMPSARLNPFRDVSPSDYYYKAVLWAVENGISNGISFNTFGPDQVCTRGQMITFLYRDSGWSMDPEVPNPFTDVKPGDYSYDAVRWGLTWGITNGTTATTFSPNAPCTRAQAVTFLFRFYLT